MNFAINLSNWRVSPLNELGNNEFSISITTGGNISISGGDRFVLLSDDIFFMSGSVLDKKTDKKNEHSEEYIHSIKLRVEKKLDTNNTIKDLAYSLIKVYKFKKPEDHFSRSYSILMDRDYFTITEGNIFWARTVLGKIGNALPKEHKMNFVKMCIDEFGTALFQGDRYGDAINSLKKYIDNNILSQGKQLMDSISMLKENLNGKVTEGEIEDIGFLGEDDHNADILMIQERKIRKLMELQERLNIWQEVSAEISEKERETEEFNETFKSVPWPLELNEE